MPTYSEKKDQILELAGEDGYIESIFSYCDRWCERCNFTSKCRNFATSENEAATDGAELWEYLEAVFKATMLMLNEMTVKMGIDKDDTGNNGEPVEPDLMDYTLSRKVCELSFGMHDWLKRNKPGELISEGIEINHSVETKRSRFKESLEVVYWYNFFISERIVRALRRVDKKNGNEIQNDSNGSAKIALIALDRLIASWSVVMENMMDHEDEILKILVSLADVRKHTEITFPLAGKFVRPGFDQ